MAEGGRGDRSSGLWPESTAEDRDPDPAWSDAILGEIAQSRDQTTQLRKIDTYISRTYTLDRQGAVALLDRGVQQIQALHQPALEREALPRFFRPYAFFCDATHAAACFGETLRLPPEIKDPAACAMHVDRYAAAAYLTEDGEQAVALLDRGIQRVRADLQPAVQVCALSRFMARFLLLGQFDEAAACLEEALQRAGRGGDLAAQLGEIARQIHATGWLMSDQWAGALWDRVARRAQDIALPFERFRALLRSSVQLTRVGWIDRAAFWLGEAFKMHADIGPAPWRADIEEYITGTSRLADRRDGVSLLRQVARQAQEILPPSLQLYVLAHLSVQAARLGDVDLSVSWWDRVLVLTEEAGNAAHRFAGIDAYIARVGRLRDRERAALLEQGARRVREVLPPRLQIEILPRFAVQLTAVGEAEQGRELLAQALDLSLRSQVGTPASAALLQATTAALGEVAPLLALRTVRAWATFLARAGHEPLFQAAFDKAEDLLPQVSLLERIEFLVGSAEALLNDSPQRSTEFLDRAFSLAQAAPGDQAGSDLLREVLARMPAVVAYVRARIQGSRQGDPLLPGRAYPLLVEIANETPGGFQKLVQGSGSDLFEFTVAVWAAGIDVQPRLQKVSFRRDKQVAALSFELVPSQEPFGQIEVNVYYKTRWAASLRLEARIGASAMAPAA